MSRITINDFKKFKQQKQPFVALTAYNYPIAKLIDACAIPLILVGDSLGMVEQGYSSTIPVTLEEMIMAGKAVTNACKQSLVIVDMPFLSTGLNLEHDVKKIKQIMQQTNAQGVKIEGAHSTILTTIKKVTSLGILVLGHIGLTPQHINTLGNYSLQGTTKKQAAFLLQQAKDLEQAGVFALVLELVEPFLAKKITQTLQIPTIGIGSGPYTNGQILVINDLLGLGDFCPKHAKKYLDLNQLITQAVQMFKKDVECKKFPSK